VFSLCFINVSYPIFLRILEPFLLENQVDFTDFSRRFVTSQRYLHIQLIVLFIAIFNSIFTLLSFRFRPKTEAFFYRQLLELLELKTSIKRGFIKVSKTEKRVFSISLMLFLLLNVGSIISFPLHIDEAFSYVFLVDRGFGVTLSYYPGPNNHVAYLLLCSIVGIFTDNPLLSMRFPVLIISLLFFVQLYLFLKSFSNWKASLLSTWLFFLTPYGMFYAAHGRGYLLFCSLILIVLTNGTQCLLKGRYYNQLLLMGAATLGLFTVPTFIYPLASLFLLWLFIAFKTKKYEKVKLFLIAAILIGVSTIVLYLPIIIFNGVDAIINNSWVQTLSYKEWLSQFPNYLSDLLQFPFGEGIFSTVLFLLNFLIGLAIWFKNRKLITKVTAVYIAGLLLTTVLPLLFISIQAVLPPIRTWLYQLILTSVLTSLVFTEIEKKIISAKYLLPLLFVFIMGFFSIKNLYNDWSSEGNIYKQVDIFTEKLLEKKATRVFIGKDIYNVFLRLEYLQAGLQVEIETDNKKLSANFEYIVLPKMQLLPKNLNFVKIYGDDYIILYEKSSSR